MTKSKCPKCGGTGKVALASDIGAEMRKLREKANVSLRSLGARMAFSAAYLSDLELGRRAWNAGLIETYRKFCK